jgi:4-amino-4-deoxy-L-arabinose transferase-like glycosyltransferase
MRMSDVTKNPPLTSYYIAGVGTAFGWDERTLHLAFLVPAVIVVLGTYLLAKGLCQRPLLAGICALFTPVFLVSSSNLMSDVLMLAFWVIAVHWWLTGLERKSGVRLFGSGVLIALSALAKYYGMVLIPLLFTYTLLKQHRWNWSMAYLLVSRPSAPIKGRLWLYGRGFP